LARENLDLGKDRRSLRSCRRGALVEGEEVAAPAGACWRVQGNHAWYPTHCGFQIFTLPAASKARSLHPLSGDWRLWNQGQSSGPFPADTLVLHLSGHKAAPAQNRKEGRGVGCLAACAPRSLPASRAWRTPGDPRGSFPRFGGIHSPAGACLQEPLWGPAYPLRGAPRRLRLFLARFGCD